MDFASADLTHEELILKRDHVKKDNRKKSRTHLDVDEMLGFLDHCQIRLMNALFCSVDASRP